MDPLGATKTTFMLNHKNYYYNSMPFDLKNVGATYQRLMDIVFSHKIGCNLEVYVDDMIVKTNDGRNHDKYLEDVLQPVRKYDMCLNPAKCSFKVQVEKFLGSC